MLKASQQRYQLNLSSISTLWMAGCIIRSKLLQHIYAAFCQQHDANLFATDYFRTTLLRCLPGWRRCVQWAVAAGTPVPGMASALAFFDALTAERLPSAQLIQAQRDFFGAHTFHWLADFEQRNAVHYDWAPQ